MSTDNKTYTKAQIALIAAFCAVLGIIFVLLLALPKHTGELSPLEFRVLADHPISGKSADKLLEDTVRGELSSNVDAFLEDHYPARSFLIALNSYYQRLTGRNANQSVIWGRNGRLFDAPLPADTTALDGNVKQINDFSEANGLKTCIVEVPTSALVCTDSLPAVHPDYHDVEFVERIEADTKAYVPDLAELYRSQEDVESLFYRTDHHWTMEGAYVCYADLCSRLGITPVSRDAFTVENYEFFGSYYREAGLWLTKPDALEVWRNDLLDSMTVTIGAADKAVVHEGVYDDEKLDEGNVDKYAAYVYSNNGLTVIENPQGNGQSLMLVKDSYGNSIAPLFAMNYSRVVMIDTRYYRDPSLPLPSELAEQYGIENLVVVFGTEAMATDSQIFYLR